MTKTSGGGGCILVTKAAMGGRGFEKGSEESGLPLLFDVLFFHVYGSQLELGIHDKRHRLGISGAAYIVSSGAWAD